MDNRRKLAEGKTKIIWTDETVEIESKDDITAGDGARRHVIAGKGALATRTAANCFRLLARCGIATHFLYVTGPAAFRARRCTMIPMEVVTRRIATGSYLKRHPDVAEGTRFDEPLVELFLKDDTRHDPLMRFDASYGVWRLFDPKLPDSSQIDAFSAHRFTFAETAVDGRVADHLSRVARNVFAVLEGAWSAHGVALADMKIEFGIDAADRSLIVADVIDNDSWRIWPGGDKTKMRDKQIYRNLATVTPEDLDALHAHYAWVADMTDAFVRG